MDGSLCSLLLKTEHTLMEYENFGGYFPCHCEHLCKTFLLCVTVPISDNVI